MPMRARLLVLILLLCAGGPIAYADDTKEVRKAFREALKTEDWKTRREAYYVLSDYDGKAVVEEVLSAMTKEKNPAVVLTAIKVLAGFESLEAQEALVHTLRKGRGAKKTFVLLALTRQRGDKANDILLETLAGKDATSAAQAALALGKKQVEAAVPALVAKLKHKDWQLRAAAARGLRSLAQPPPPKPRPGASPAEIAKLPKKMPVPDFMKEPSISQALLASLQMSKGSERGAVIATLEAIHEKEYGLNIDAWKKVLAGEEVDKRTLRKRKYPPHIYGIPIYGRRIVLVLDNSLRTGDPHRFGSGARMRELCEVPGGRALLGSRLRTVRQFSAAHYKRCISDMPKDVKFELLIYDEVVKPVFGKLTSANGGTKKLAHQTIEEAKADNGIATFPALTQALDISGAKDSAAWKKGPDEIVFVTSNVPTAGEITDADVVGAAIAMKARLRMVPIHTIGIETHPYDMLRQIAEETGATYRNYYE